VGAEFVPQTSVIPGPIWSSRTAEQHHHRVLTSQADGLAALFWDQYDNAQRSWQRNLGSRPAGHVRFTDAELAAR